MTSPSKGFGVFLKSCVLAVLVIVSAGCSQLQEMTKLPEFQPWVAPYERGLLSREEMVRERHTYPSQFREHVYSVRGASQGATGSQGGGCGCN
jgi:hypothetical protein